MPDASEIEAPAFFEPLALTEGQAAEQAVQAGRALWLAGGPLAFALVRLDGKVLALDAVPPETLARLAAPVPNWAGLGHGAVMGVLNVTPDSFSGDGWFNDPGRAIAVGVSMVAAGAALIDVGGESTRPGAADVTPEEECARVIPVIRGLVGQGIAVSVDTRNGATMLAALEAGARVINDVSALRNDPDAARIVAAAGCPVVLMHSRHSPRDMTERANYRDIAREVTQELALRVAAAEAMGIAAANIAIDPGIGFAKTAELNLLLLPRLAMLVTLGRRIVIGVSRKGFVGKLAAVADPRRRASGSVAAGLHALAHGASILRAHDVADTVQAVRVWRGVAGA